MENFIKRNCLQAVIALALVFAGFTMQAQITVVNDITTNTTWTTGNTYILDGYIFVRDGATLTIQPGVIVRGLGQKSGPQPSNPEERVGALIVTRTGNIDAQGSAAQPIIFTAFNDDLSDPNDFDCDSTGFWGGVVLLGNATVSSPIANFNGSFVENEIEGIITTNPMTAQLALYGGNDDNDNSGILRYVSIRHGGDVLTDGDEINGLTLGGVGRGTTIEYVDVIANADDGIEFFGGTVDTRYCLVTCVTDDSYDYDQGFRGRGQFWVTIGTGNRLGEHDGGDKPDDATPFSTPVVFNATYIGKAAASGEQEVIVFRDNAGGNYKNSIFHQSQQGLEIEYRYDIISSYFQFSTVVNDDTLGSIQALDINNNTFSNINGNSFFVNENSTGFTGSTQQIRGISNANSTLLQLSNGTLGNNATATNLISSPGGAGTYDMRPTAAATNLSAEPTPWFIDVNYAGAVDPNAATAAGWMQGWTAASEYGIIQ